MDTGNLSPFQEQISPSFSLFALQFFLLVFFGHDRPEKDFVNIGIEILSSVLAHVTDIQ